MSYNLWKLKSPVDRRALMVATKHEEIFRVFDFVRQKQANTLKTLSPAIHQIQMKSSKFDM